ncbi:MAG: glycine cleavage system protein GcvH [Chlamydiota bacterium]|nr:glycine cleavage system protein GcvH [Chlamydiota bacterium]
MKFTETHEWIKVSEDIGTVGVTDHAQHELGDIVFIELPEVGKKINAKDEAAVLESTKAAADVYSPVTGTIVEVNEVLNDESELVNESAEDNGWLFKIKIDNPQEVADLMDRATYESKFA